MRTPIQGTQLGVWHMEVFRNIWPSVSIQIPTGYLLGASNLTWTKVTSLKPTSFKPALPLNFQIQLMTLSPYYLPRPDLKIFLSSSLFSQPLHLIVTRSFWFCLPMSSQVYHFLANSAAIVFIWAFLSVLPGVSLLHPNNHASSLSPQVLALPLLYHWSYDLQIWSCSSAVFNLPIVPANLDARGQDQHARWEHRNPGALKTDVLNPRCSDAQWDRK